MSFAMIWPLLALVFWTIAVVSYMGYTRFAAIARSGIRLGEHRGGRGQDLEGVLDARTMWPAHNYNNLLEQPTLFYAVVLALAVMGDRAAGSLALAWGYVAVRVGHSIYQMTINSVPTRARLFLAANVILLLLAGRAAWLAA